MALLFYTPLFIVLKTPFVPSRYNYFSVLCSTMLSLMKRTRLLVQETIPRTNQVYIATAVNNTHPYSNYTLETAVQDFPTWSTKRPLHLRDIFNIFTLKLQRSMVHEKDLNLQLHSTVHP